MYILGNDFFRRLHTNRNNGGEEFNHTKSVLFASIKEIQTVSKFLDVDGVCMGTMLEDELFEKKKSSLVGDLLANLNDGFPGVLSSDTSAVLAMLIGDDVFDNKDLLENGSSKDLFLYGKLELDPAGMRLCPNETGIHQTNLAEAAKFLETEGEQLLTLKLGLDPDTWRLQIALAAAAKVHGSLLRDAFGDVHLIADAVNAHVGRVWRDQRRA